MVKLPFDFQATEELPGGHCSRVYANEARVLKVPFQGEEMESGFRASLAMARTVGPRVHEAEPETGAILMARVRPGTKLCDAGLEDEAMNVVFHQMVRSIQSLPNDDYVPIAKYHEQPGELVDALQRTAEPQFLHGDLHHENILQDAESPTGWTLIDPKGLWGEACFEAVAWLRNPYRKFKNAADTKAQIIQKLAWFERAFGWEPDRILAYASLDAPSLNPELWGPYILAIEQLVQERGIDAAHFLS
jgi:streptomycin 6-kinase